MICLASSLDLLKSSLKDLATSSPGMRSSIAKDCDVPGDDSDCTTGRAASREHFAVGGGGGKLKRDIGRETDSKAFANGSLDTEMLLQQLQSKQQHELKEHLPALRSLIASLDDGLTSDGARREYGFIQHPALKVASPVAAGALGILYDTQYPSKSAGESWS